MSLLLCDKKNINKICDMAVKNTLNNKQCEQYLLPSSNDGIQIHWIYSPHTLSHELTWQCFKNMIWKGIFVRKNTLEMRLVYQLDLPKQLTEGICRSSILTISMSTLHNYPGFSISKVTILISRIFYTVKFSILFQNISS